MNFSLSFVQDVSVESTNWTTVYHRMHHVYLSHERGIQKNGHIKYSHKEVHQFNAKIIQGKKKGLSHNWLSDDAIRYEEKQVTKNARAN